jgi:hypothetical protein
MDQSFENSVFINCPYDAEYYRILLPILFVLVSAELNPILASDSQDSGSIRLQRIIEYIRRAKYSIHDLSRTELSEHGNPRFNMPFELGLDYGCKEYGDEQYRSKVFLILEGQVRRSQPVLSDISGLDPKAHQNDPQRAVSVVRNWLESEVFADNRQSFLPGAQVLMDEFDYFMSWNNAFLHEHGFSDEEITNRSKSLIVKDMQDYLKRTSI